MIIFVSQLMFNISLYSIFSGFVFEVVQIVMEGVSCWCVGVYMRFVDGLIVVNFVLYYSFFVFVFVVK